jgi:hypothetical protein
LQKRRERPFFSGDQRTRRRERPFGTVQCVRVPNDEPVILRPEERVVFDRRKKPANHNKRNGVSFHVDRFFNRNHAHEIDVLKFFVRQAVKSSDDAAAAKAGTPEKASDPKKAPAAPKK